MKRKPRMVYWIGYAHGYEGLSRFAHRRRYDYDRKSDAESYRNGYAAGQVDRMNKTPSPIYAKSIWPRLPQTV